MKGKIVRKTITRKLRKVGAKNNTKILAFAAILVAATFIIPSICAGQKWTPQMPPGDESFIETYEHPVPVSDCDINCIPPEKVQADKLSSSSGNMFDVYLQ